MLRDFWNDFWNLYRLDRFTRIGRACQLLGFASAVGPIAGAMARASSPDPIPSSVLDALPAFNPVVISLRYQYELVAANLVAGVWLMYLGTAFLAVSSWALDGMRTTCLVSAGLSVTAALLFGISIVGTLNPAARFLTLGCTASALVWAIFLLWLARELGKPEYRQKFQAAAS